MSYLLDLPVSPAPFSLYYYRYSENKDHSLLFSPFGSY
jgi:hypothetical protein